MCIILIQLISNCLSISSQFKDRFSITIVKNTISFELFVLRRKTSQAIVKYLKIIKNLTI